MAKKKAKGGTSYLIKINHTRQQDAVSLFMKVFGNSYKCDVSTQIFPINQIFVYVILFDGLNLAKLQILQTPSDTEPDIELQTLSDMETIPLMHSAIKASKEFSNGTV